MVVGAVPRFWSVVNLTIARLAMSNAAPQPVQTLALLALDNRISLCFNVSFTLYDLLLSTCKSGM